MRIGQKQTPRGTHIKFLLDKNLNDNCDVLKKNTVCSHFHEIQSNIFRVVV